jgi:multiple sugar transport system permease protein
MGKASAMAWFLFLMLAVITALKFWGARFWVYYEGEKK